MSNPRVAVFGAGFVGATTAQYLVQQEIADVVLIDIIDGIPQGKALDLMESACLIPTDATVTGATDPAACAGCDLVVITSGLPRKPGMSRDDLLLANAGIVRTVCEAIKQHAPEAFVIVVTNPLDAMTNLAHAVLGFTPQRILGMAGVLDSARMRHFLAAEIGVSVRDVDAMVIGGHGDDMVPLLRFATVSGVPVESLIPADKLEAIVTRTRNGGAEIVSLLKTGSAYYSPALSVTVMARAILHDERRLLPCCVWCEGQYGIDGMFVGVPAYLGANGVEGIVELALAAEESVQLQSSAAHVRENLVRLGLL